MSANTRAGVYVCVFVGKEWILMFYKLLYVLGVRLTTVRSICKQ